MEAVKYSKYDLLGQVEKQLSDEPPRLWELIGRAIKPRSLPFSFYVPNDLYLRGKVLCDDVNKMTETQKELTQCMLVEYLFSIEFMYRVRRNTAYELFIKIINREKQLPLERDNPIIFSRSMSQVETKIHKDDIYRAEVFLKDVEYHSQHNFTVERLINVIYQDFLIEYLRGRRSYILEELIVYMDDLYS